jgi:DNA-binding CsgD family transcriptional regulator
MKSSLALVPRMSPRPPAERRRERPPVAAGLILERLPCAVLIADRDGHVLEMNTPARQLLASEQGLRLVDDRLCIDNGADQDKLRATLAAVHVGNGAAAGPEPVVVSANGAPLALIVDALAPGLAMISIPSARRSADAHEDLIRRLFGLSPSQARLTALLVGGRSVKEAAGALGIAESSARQYLKVVFSKTDTRGQADLVRMVGGVLLLQV